MWLLWLICFQFSLLLFYWIQAGTQAVTVDWGHEQFLMWGLACGFYLVVSYLRWCSLPKIKQLPAKQFRVFAWALTFGLLPLFYVYMQMPTGSIAGGNGIAVLGVLCLLQLAPSYATPGYEFEAVKPSK